MCDDGLLIRELAPIPAARAFGTSMNDVVKRLGDWRAKSGVFYDALRQIQPLLIQAADSEGNLREEAERSTRGAVDRIMMRVFVGEDGRNAFAEDGVTALSPFAQMLNEMYVRVVVEAIYTQRDWMRRNVPPDVFEWLATVPSRTNLLEMAEGSGVVVRELTDEEIDALRIFRPNPMMELDPSRQWVPMHRWNTPDGYRLSDRIWRTSDETRRQIDRLLAQGFADGSGALSLADALEAYLIPGEEGVRTLKPYGSFYMPGGASAWAMRLARTEIARAANHAAYMSALLNPYVDTIDVRRSSTGMRKVHNCTDLATVGFNGERLRPAYSVNSAVLPPYHPSCKCFVTAGVTDNADEVTRRLRAMIEQDRAAVIPAATPAQASALTQMLLHRSLNTIVNRVVGQLGLPGF